jgi:hypothetical protein
MVFFSTNLMHNSEHTLYPPAEGEKKGSHNRTACQLLLPCLLRLLPYYFSRTITDPFTFIFLPEQESSTSVAFAESFEYQVTLYFPQ